MELNNPLDNNVELENHPLDDNLGLGGPSDHDSNNPIAPPRASQAVFTELQHWRNVIDTALKGSDEEDDEGQFFMTADDIDRASLALLDFIMAQHSGEDNLPRRRQSELNVRIRKHSSISGLFFPSSVTIFVYVSNTHLITTTNTKFLEEEDVVTE